MLFGLKAEDDDLVHLDIRFKDYGELQIEGDQLMLGLDEAGGNSANPILYRWNMRLVI